MYQVLLTVYWISAQRSCYTFGKYIIMMHFFMFNVHTQLHLQKNFLVIIGRRCVLTFRKVKSSLSVPINKQYSNFVERQLH